MNLTIKLKLSENQRVEYEKGGFAHLHLVKKAQFFDQTIRNIAFELVEPEQKEEIEKVVKRGRKDTKPTE